MRIRIEEKNGEKGQRKPNEPAQREKHKTKLADQLIQKLASLTVTGTTMLVSEENNSQSPVMIILDYSNDRNDLENVAKKWKNSNN